MKNAFSKKFARPALAVIVGLIPGITSLIFESS
jgi:hypothetical protein